VQEIRRLFPLCRYAYRSTYLQIAKDKIGKEFIYFCYTLDGVSAAD